MSKKTEAVVEDTNDDVNNPPAGDSTVAVLDLADAQSKAFDQGHLEGYKAGYYAGIDYVQQVLGVRVISTGEEK